MPRMIVRSDRIVNELGFFAELELKGILIMDSSPQKSRKRDASQAVVQRKPRLQTVIFFTLYASIPVIIQDS